MAAAINAEVTIPIAGAHLEGSLTLPAAAKGIVVFAHGSGSSRFSQRNIYVADILNAGGFATLLFDLLTAGEEKRDADDASLRFDIPMLSRRLCETIDWVRADDRTRDLPLGLFGASTGAAAALNCAGFRPGLVKAIVSRGGRPDLAGPALETVMAPTLLIVGSEDGVVLHLNEQAMARMIAPSHLAIVPGATHLFEEPGTLDHAARLALDWFQRNLT
ncbi:MAG: dienelactone hydrolase family protein [Dehalococcoidia bacterium]|nr:dienelactone hydrolase family protein [Dehalococcoidia bacterium]